MSGGKHGLVFPHPSPTGSGREVSMGSREGLNLTAPTLNGGLEQRDPELCAQQDSYRVYRLSTTSPLVVHELNERVTKQNP